MLLSGLLCNVWCENHTERLISELITAYKGVQDTLVFTIANFCRLAVARALKQLDATSPGKCSGDCQKSLSRNRTFLTGAKRLREGDRIKGRLDNTSSTNSQRTSSITDWYVYSSVRQSKDTVSLFVACVFLCVCETEFACVLACRSLYDLLPSGL